MKTIMMIMMVNMVKIVKLIEMILIRKRCYNRTCLMKITTFLGHPWKRVLLRVVLRVMRMVMRVKMWGRIMMNRRQRVIIKMQM
jgi:hypothetical protein